jgi:hypothetical protein
MTSTFSRRTLSAFAAALTIAAITAPGSATARPHAVTSASPNAVSKAFSFVGKPGSQTSTVVNIDSLVINARCSSAGSPIVFAFTSAASADLFGRVFDGVGRFHNIHDSAFKKRSSVSVNPSSNDFDTTGTLEFETSTGRVVTVELAMDNSTTLGNQRVCTVYGTLTAS